jgi:serine/threonine protein kinase
VVFRAFDRRWKRDVIVKAPLDSSLVVESEYEIQVHIHHPNIIYPLGTTRTRFGNAIILPFVELGSVRDSDRPAGDEAYTRAVTYDILKALQYLHNRKEEKCMHRDIKPENILDNGRVFLLGDFGHAKIFTEEDVRAPVEGEVGTPEYVPPEYLNHRIYGTEGEIWALGVTAFVIYSHRFPFSPMERDKEIKLGLLDREIMPVLNQMSAEGRDALLQMLCQYDQERITIAKLLNHPWFAVTLGQVHNPRNPTVSLSDEIGI